MTEPETPEVNLHPSVAALSEIDEELLFADGFEDAIIGLAELPCKSAVVAYDRKKCIQIMVDRDGMTEEEAIECFDFNTAGAYVGERTPVYITLLADLEVM